ncbi:MAG: hypothetical protein COA45_06650 [Zetaproteobacteria bacterium]|nr:MAG: hypothetical protein COA45_06650 [Zetaproteobacteria bacterium]
MRYMFIVTVMSLLCFFGGNNAVAQSSLYQGNAQYDRGLRYYLGQDVDRDYDEAARQWHISAEHGHKDSQFMLGDMYYHGRGVTKDIKKAYAWFDTAAKIGFAQAGPARDRLVSQMDSMTLRQAQSLSSEYFRLYANP